MAHFYFIHFEEFSLLFTATLKWKVLHQALKETYYTLFPLASTIPCGLNKMSATCFGQNTIRMNNYRRFSTLCKPGLNGPFLSVGFRVCCFKCKWVPPHPAPLLWVRLLATMTTHDHVPRKNMAAGDNTVLKPDIFEPESDSQE